MSETSTIVTPSIKALNGIPGVLAYRVHSGRVKVVGGWMHLGPAGFPDIGCCINGLSVFLEAKLPGKKPTSQQLSTHLWLRKSGAFVYTIESVHDALDIARRFLRIPARVTGATK